MHASDDERAAIGRDRETAAPDRGKAALFEAIAIMGRAFASPVRLELLDLLAQSPRTVEQLARASRQSVANTSQHLQTLRAAGLVSRGRDGARVHYEIAGDEALRVWLSLRDASVMRLAEVERAVRAHVGPAVETIGRAELLSRLRSGEVVLIDVRPAEEYAAGHIDGARSIPLDELERRLAELPEEREIVAYCRGPICAYAHEAVRRLHAAGRQARVLSQGWPEWRIQSRRPQRAARGMGRSRDGQGGRASARPDGHKPGQAKG